MDRHTIKFILWNMRSIKPRLSDLEFYIRKYNIDVICMQEPFAAAAKMKIAPSIKGYHSYVNTAITGLLTYVKVTLPHKLVKKSENTDVQFHHLKIQTASGYFSLYNIYARSSKFLAVSLPIFHNQGTLCMGDLNARHPHFGDSQRNSNGEEFKHFINSRSLTVYDTEIETHLGGGRLDYVFGKNLVHGNVCTSLVRELVSDHFAIRTDYTVDSNSAPKTPRLRIIIPPGLEHHFKARVFDWYNTYEVTTVENFSQDLIKVVTDYYNTWVCSRKLSKKKSPQAPHAPRWINDPILAKEHQRVQELANCYKDNKTSDNLIQFLKANKEFRELKTEIRSKHWEQFSQSINSQTSMADVWKKFNRLTGKAPTTPQFHSPQEQANMLLEQWAENSQLNSLPQGIKDHLDKSKIDRKFNIAVTCAAIDPSDFAEITEWELRNALVKGKATAPGEDGITYSVLRLIAQVPGNPLLHLYRLSLSQGILPSSWTKSLIIPIPKSNTDKYRPISLTSCLCKVLERIILNRLMYRIHAKLSPRLYGFLPGRSSQHCFA